MYYICLLYTSSPTEIVNKALKLTEKDSPVVIALTDHDTVAGIDEFQKAAAKHKDRLTAISGLEISTDVYKRQGLSVSIRR